MAREGKETEKAYGRDEKRKQYKWREEMHRNERKKKLGTDDLDDDDDDEEQED